MSGSRGRQPLPDALRALAMLSVLMVNAAGYLVAPWGPLLGERAPADSSAAQVVQCLIGTLLQGKGYPVLAFLFGVGLWLSTRRAVALAPHPHSNSRALLRQKRLLSLGVVHGTFIYFGDILTNYALVGWNLLARVREPWHSLRRRLWRALWWALGVAAVSVLLTWWLGPPGGGMGDPVTDPDAPLVQAQSWVDFWWANASAYAGMQMVGLLWSWPLLRLCMLCGIAAARLRLLTHRRWRAAMQRWVLRLALPAGLLNLVYGLATSSVATDSQRAYWIDAFGTFLIGPPLAAVYVMALALAARGGNARWCRWLAPLGQRTLTLYVGHSLLCVGLFSGVGWGLAPGTVAMAAFSLALWLLTAAAAGASGGRRWPLEAWLARR